MSTSVTLPLLLLSALHFTEQDLPGLVSDNLSYNFNLASAPYRQSDMDGDGKVDLLLPRSLFLQRNGQFDVEHAIPMPDCTEPALCDVWGRSLFVVTPHELREMELDGPTWRAVIDQPFCWPDLGDQRRMLPPTKGQADLQFDRFLQDVDQDGMPEVVIAERAGLVIFRKTGNEFVEAGRLNVYPLLAVAHMSIQPLWPESARQVVLPARTMTCRVAVAGSRLTVVSQESCGGDHLRYCIRHFVIAKGTEGQFAAQEQAPEETAPLPACMQPMRLNDDDVTDFAGGDWHMADNAPVPMPISEISVSTDGGKSVQTVRSVAFGPARAFVDIDGDGRLDLVAESTGMFNGGVREMLMRFLTLREIPHEVHIHLQGKDGRFSMEPDLVFRTIMVFDAPPARESTRFMEYQRGGLVNVCGDFDGDGRRDLCIYDGPDRLAVYLNRGRKVISGTPDVTIAVPPGTDFDVVDFNQDGLSDIVCCVYKEGGGMHSSVWFAGK